MINATSARALQTASSRNAEPEYDGPIFLAPTKLVRTPAFCAETAKKLIHLPGSSDAKVVMVDGEIHHHHTGPLYDEDGSLLDPMTFLASDEFPDADAGAWLNAFEKCADKPYERLLQLRCVRRVQFLHAALQINYARYGAPF